MASRFYPSTYLSSPPLFPPRHFHQPILTNHHLFSRRCTAHVLDISVVRQRGNRDPSVAYTSEQRNEKRNNLEETWIDCVIPKFFFKLSRISLSIYLSSRRILDNRRAWTSRRSRWQCSTKLDANWFSSNSAISFRVSTCSIRSPPSTFSSRSSGDKFPLTRFHLTARHQTRVSCRAEFPFRRCPSTKSVLRYAANARLAGVPSG